MKQFLFVIIALLKRNLGRIRLVIQSGEMFQLVLLKGGNNPAVKSRVVLFLIKIKALRQSATQTFYNARDKNLSSIYLNSRLGNNGAHSFDEIVFLPTAPETERGAVILRSLPDELRQKPDVRLPIVVFFRVA